MVICRFRLVPRFLVTPSPPLLHNHVVITKSFSSKATILSRQCLPTPISLHLPPSAHLSQRDLSPTDDIETSGDFPSGWLAQDTNEQHSTTSDQDEAKKERVMGDSPTLDMLYARLNIPEFSKLATQLSSEQVRAIALRAETRKHPYVLDNLSRNILDSPKAVRTELAIILLSIPHLSLIPSLTASLLLCITHDDLSSLSLDALSHITCTLIHHPSPPNSAMLLSRLVEHITDRLELFWRKNHRPSSSGRHIIPVWDLFRLVMHLSERDLREPATRVLQSLMELTYIPPEAIQRMDQSSGDFHSIIMLTLVRSCIFWKWNSRALALLRSYLDREPSAGPVINRLCQDALYALLEFPTVEDLDLGVSFVKDLLSSPEPIIVSPGIVRKIYSSAERLGKPRIAASLYKLSQYKPAHSFHKFPLPSGSALTWFLRNLSSRAAYMHLARHLVKQVADGCEPIPLEDRAQFIAIAAESGFASPARFLWERYCSGRGGQIVAGNAAMMVRMCSLFAGLHRGKVAHKSESSELVNPIIGSDPHDDANDLHPSVPQDDKDFRNFANLVLTRYREAKEPLQHASREDLNALARANIILGHYTEALQALKIVVHRNERPDLHDVNVILSAISDFDPRMALTMVRRMVEFGPKPDAISFGTVIHHAARHGDIGAIIGLLRLARKTGEQLTTKTVVTVIRASVVLSGEDKGAVRDNLVHALGVITANEHSKHLATQDMGRFCVDEALKADDPALAFIFWKRVLRTRAEWNDNLHMSTRRRIALSLRSHWEKGDIDTEEYYEMTYALKGRGKGGHG